MKVWVVVRQDTHGNRFDVASFPTEAAASERVAQFERGYPHHQGYFVEVRELAPSRRLAGNSRSASDRH